MSHTMKISCKKEWEETKSILSPSLCWHRRTRMKRSHTWRARESECMMFSETQEKRSGRNHRPGREDPISILSVLLHRHRLPRSKKDHQWKLGRSDRVTLVKRQKKTRGSKFRRKKKRYG